MKKTCIRIKPLLIEKFYRALQTPGSTWRSLTIEDKRDLVSFASLAEMNNALEDGLWPTYGVKKGFDRDHPAEAFVVKRRPSANLYLIAYIKPGVKEVSFALKSGKHIIEERSPSQILGG